MALDKLPSGITYSTNCSTEVNSNGSCHLDFYFNPMEGSSASSYEVIVGYESVDSSFYLGQIQRRYKTINFTTNILENGIIIPYQVISEVDENGVSSETRQCSDDPLAMEAIIHNKDNIDLEVNAIKIEIGEQAFEDIYQGVYKNFCIKNPKTLPVYLWDDNENWTPETVNGFDGMVKVYSSVVSNFQVYFEERCLLKSFNSLGVLKDKPDNAENFGIQNDESCFGMIYYRPGVGEINNQINSVTSAFEYYSNTPLGSEPPSLIMGVVLSGKINAPAATAVRNDESVERSTYQISTTSESVSIQWQEFLFNEEFGKIDKYLVYIDQNAQNLKSDLLIISKSKNESLAQCVVDGGSLTGDYECVVEGLNSSSRYYVRVIPSIELEGVNYVSFEQGDKNTYSFYTSSINSSFAYDYERNIYLDTDLISETSEFDREEAFAACENSSIEVLLNESNSLDIDKSQITLNEWAVILSDIPKFNLDENIIRTPIILDGTVPSDFGGVELSNNSSSETFNVSGDYYYLFKWSGSIPEEFSVATLDELPLSLDDIPEYGSLFLHDVISTKFNTRCFTILPD